MTAATDPMHHHQTEQPHAPLVCGAATRNGGTCRNPPMLGGTRCRMHGGAAPQVRAKAAAEQQQARAADGLTTTCQPWHAQARGRAS